MSQWFIMQYQQFVPVNYNLSVCLSDFQCCIALYCDMAWYCGLQCVTMFQGVTADVSVLMFQCTSCMGSVLDCCSVHGEYFKVLQCVW